MTPLRFTRAMTTLACLFASMLVARKVDAQTASADSAAIARAIESFHSAIERGDSVAALALLAPGAVILESGSAENVAEYRSHHLPADIEFARAIKSMRTGPRIQVRGAMAFAASTSTTQGEFKGRAVNSAGAELLVLERGANGWMISAIHWSSRRRN